MPIAKPRTRVRTRASVSTLPFIAENITLILTDDIRVARPSARKHADKQVGKVADSISDHGFMVPLVVTAEQELVSGHARLAAAKLLGMTHVPTVCAAHLSAQKLRAYGLAENRLAELSEWDNPVLQADLTFIMEGGIDLTQTNTGFEMGEVDLILGSGEDQASDDGDDAEVALPEGIPVTRVGDKWICDDGRLTIVCGDSRAEETYERLLSGEKVALVATDPPWNVAVNKIVSDVTPVSHPAITRVLG